MSHPPTLRAECARLAALRRWRHDDAATTKQAQCDLLVAQADTLAAAATKLLRGEKVDS